MSGTQIFELITGMLSGLALFIFGMNVMSDTLTQMAGGSLSGAIDKLTGKRIAGWAFGTLLAVFVQSSVTTVMTVGLVNSEIITVAQSVGVMIDRFYRVDEARNSEGHHYGLGLSIAKAVAEKHGGNISVSYKDGKVRFTVTIPEKNK